EVLGLIGQVHEDGPDEMDDAEQPLGVEVPVRNEPDDERCDDRAPRLRGVREPYLRPGRIESVRQVAAHRDEPRAPDEELEEHHHRQPYSCVVCRHYPHLWFLLLDLQEPTSVEMLMLPE